MISNINALKSVLEDIEGHYKARDEEDWAGEVRLAINLLNKPLSARHKRLIIDLLDGYAERMRNLGIILTADSVDELSIGLRDWNCEEEPADAD